MLDFISSEQLNIESKPARSIPDISRWGYLFEPVEVSVPTSVMDIHKAW